MWVLALDWEDPLDEGMAIYPVFCLENPMDRGDWWATVHGVHKESSTTEVAQHKHSYNDHKSRGMWPLLMDYRTKLSV